MWMQRKIQFNFVTHFLRNGSTKLQSFVYHFVGNFKLLLKYVKDFSEVSLYLELRLSEVTMSCGVYSILALEG